MFAFVREDALTKASDIDSNSDHFKTKKYFQENKLSGLYQEFDPFTDQLREEGHFQNGVETGKWRVIDQDGDERHYMYQLVRVGARCRDGSFSQATGRGACSWHGGVAEWLMGSQKTLIGGTGKYAPIEKRVETLRSKVKLEFGFNSTGLQLEQQILKIALKEREEIRALKKQLEQTKLELKEQMRKQVELQKTMRTQAEQKSVSEDLKPSKDIAEDKKTQPKFSHKRQYIKGQSQKQSSHCDNSIVSTKQQKTVVRQQEELQQSEEQQKKLKLRNAFENYKLKQGEDEDESESEDEQRSHIQSALIRELMQRMNISDSK